jgi:hypothetical protein
MWHGGTDAETDSRDGAIRIERLGRAVDEIVGLHAGLSGAETADWADGRRKLAAASRRLWALAVRPDPHHPAQDA